MHGKISIAEKRYWVKNRKHKTNRTRQKEISRAADGFSFRPSGEPIACNISAWLSALFFLRMERRLDLHDFFKHPHRFSSSFHLGILMTVWVFTNISKDIGRHRFETMLELYLVCPKCIYKWAISSPASPCSDKVCQEVYAYHVCSLSLDVEHMPVCLLSSSVPQMCPPAHPRGRLNFSQSLEILLLKSDRR